MTDAELPRLIMTFFYLISVLPASTTKKLRVYRAPESNPEKSY